jgi:raffinose/stachyose/melibiose transport system substrate-binding protein
MPMAFDLIGIFYNRTLLDEAGLTAPRTFDELIAFCGTAREQGYIPVAFGNNPGWQAFHQFSMTANQMIGPEAMRSLLFEHEGSWDTPEIVAAIAAYFVDMRDAGCFPDDVNAIGSDDANALFYSGQALLRPWPSGEFVQQMPDYEVGFMPFPEIEGGHGPVWVTGVSSAWFITSAAEDPDAAAAFIDYLFSPAAIELWLADGEGTMPIELDLEAFDLAPMQETTFAILQSEDVQFGYNIDVLAPAPFNDMMRSGFQLVLAGSKTPEQQAADLQAAWEDGLAAD